MLANFIYLLIIRCHLNQIYIHVYIHLIFKKKNVIKDYMYFSFLFIHLNIKISDMIAYCICDVPIHVIFYITAEFCGISMYSSTIKKKCAGTTSFRVVQETTEHRHGF